MAANEHYIISKGLDVAEGRNFTQQEVMKGSNVAMIGDGVKQTLFKENEDPINQDISFLGTKYRVIGVLDKKGG